ncbi:MAG TPA: hypothetical protein VE871_16650 [Longimicrobium sp.]|nr:hypothetical protein [Longimicrobium sp.]
MRRLKFVIPMLLLAGACSAPSTTGPTTDPHGTPSTSVAADSTMADPPADDTPQRDGGIMMGSGG